jgi:phenylacetate-CoA ligase
MASTLKRIIDNQPGIFKKISYKIIPFKYRYGNKFNEFYALIQKSKEWSYDEARNYQLTQLRNLLTYSEKNVPYYGSLFKEVGFDPNIKHIDQLNQLPYLTKDIVINNYDNLISTSFDGKKYQMSTSGTSGVRLTFQGSDDLFKIEAAFILNAFHDHKANMYDDHSVWIRRYSPQQGDPIFYIDHELNRSYMSAFHLNDDTIHSYIDYINSTKSRTLVSYPSTIYYLALLCLKYNLKLKHVKALHGASELCLPQWRSIIKKAFGVPIKMHYGQVEKVSFSHQDLEDDHYKENLLYGLNEYDDDAIVGTGFYNYVMPFIRYKTNDKVELVKNPILNSSTPKTIKEILGRNGDMLITDKNSYVPAVNFYSFMSKYDQVDLFQIVQYKETRSVDFFIVPNLKFNSDVEKKLYDEMIYRLGNVDVNIVKIDHLHRDKLSNKLKTVALI